jgi:hypothetical protein
LPALVRTGRRAVLRHDSSRPEQSLEIAASALPYENPVFLERLRRVYRAIYERYKDEPLVALYHGTWSAGPFDEIFVPIRSAPKPPSYTAEKFARGMREQLDILLEEFSLKGQSRPSCRGRACAIRARNSCAFCATARSNGWAVAALTFVPIEAREGN